ncbi:hypothetical protein IQ266_16395 [filamentous cyanobacterium LEGE 11480]|uniref:Circadian oscillating protein COP23 n=1 Tax=Romeriopsis navalis LEGE 11480 TaxID=2777977 RepID=A0A928VQY2_9CYAN|nr:COP23 domain-containing protein [Romeriopsis navalis]MBE9031316.1 hypothetical protein [Romeriopsis navalis LEGE 11480]
MSLPQTRFSIAAHLISAIGVIATANLIAASGVTAQTVSGTTVPTTDVVVPTGAGGSTANAPIDTGTVPTNTGTVPTNGDSTVPTGTIPTTGDVPLNAVRFSCRLENGQHTVMYQPESQPGQYYAWAVPQQMGGGWTPERRCNEISRRLESYRPEGLVEMQTAVENGYNTVCVTTDNVPSCRIVFTVPRGQDPVATRNSVFENLAIADSGQRTSGIATFRDGQGDQVLGQLGKALNIDLGGLFGQPQPVQAAPTRQGIYLKPFLDRADGGTGTQLNQRPRRSSRVQPRKGLRLRDVFR